MTVVQALRAAATCPWCGAKMWPPGQVEAHLMLHELHYLVHAEELKKVQHSFDRMKDLPWASEGEQ